MKITVEDYVQHLSQYKFNVFYDPELVHGTTHQFHNEIHAEFYILYHWHPLVPDYYEVRLSLTLKQRKYYIQGEV